MSTHNICFREEIRKIFIGYPIFSGAVRSYSGSSLAHQLVSQGGNTKITHKG